MSVLIKGMEMPKCCQDCPLHNYEGAGYWSCCVLGKVDNEENVKAWKKRKKDCPLVEVPPHGRLIDADANIGVNVTMMPGGKCRVDLIAPTIIPAEDGE